MAKKERKLRKTFVVNKEAIIELGEKQRFTPDALAGLLNMSPQQVKRWFSSKKGTSSPEGAAALLLLPLLLAEGIDPFGAEPENIRERFKALRGRRDGDALGEHRLYRYALVRESLAKGSEQAKASRALLREVTAAWDTVEREGRLPDAVPSAVAPLGDAFNPGGSL